LNEIQRETQMKLELTEEEKRAIKALERLEKIWPDSLWLYSASGTLWIMKKGHDKIGHFYPIYNKNGSVDSDYLIKSINIDNDGGDW
jgi:hypothetical protein